MTEVLIGLAEDSPLDDINLALREAGDPSDPDALAALEAFGVALVRRLAASDSEAAKDWSRKLAARLLARSEWAGAPGEVLATVIRRVAAVAAAAWVATPAARATRDLVAAVSLAERVLEIALPQRPEWARWSRTTIHALVSERIGKRARVDVGAELWPDLLGWGVSLDRQDFWGDSLATKIKRACAEARERQRRGGMGRNEARAQARERALSEESSGQATRSTDPAESAARQEAVDVLRSFLASLDDHDRAALLAHADGVTLAEIGRRLGMSDVAAGKRVRSTRDKLERFKRLNGL